MNTAHFIGRVGKDAEVRYTQGGKAVADFSMALDNGKAQNGEKRPPTWVKAVLWEKKAEALAQYITKGKLVAVTGPVSTEAWVGKQDGNAQAKIVITVREFEFCGGPKSEGTADGEGSQEAPARPQADGSSGPITDEDIPF